ncbi:MAG: hypothetical protein FH749_15995 [Firmicutes bacterium]|nr:hypothetical protein [Bacillota bacterium]
MSFKPLLRLFRETPELRIPAIITALVVIAEVAIAPALAHTLRQLVDGFLGQQTTVYWRLAPIAFGIFILHAFVAWARNKIMGWIAERGTASLRKRAADSLLNMPVPRLDSIHTGDHLSRLTNDVSVLTNYLNRQLFWLFALPLMALASMGYQAYISWQLTLATFVLMPVMIWLTAQASRPITKISRNLQEDLAAVNNVTQDALGGAEIVKAFNLQPEMERRYDEGLQGTVKNGLRLARQNALLRAIAGFTPFILPLALGG